MTDVLEIKGLSKNYGKLKAVQNLNLNIKKGQVYGILGPNGSGKTTTLGMILDVVASTSGSYSWFEGMAPIAARKQIGAILETPCFYPYLTAVQNLRITAHIKETPFSRIDTVIEQVGLTERKHDKFKTYSLGMKQRLSIAAALLADPPVLILDEPTNGLDPQGIAEIRTLIRDIAANGKTILLASHLLDEVQKVCTHFCVLRKGVKLHEGSVEDILGETNEIEVSATDIESLKTHLERFDGIDSIQKEIHQIVLKTKEGVTSEEINKYCFEKGITLKKVVTRNKSLEQEFLKILEEK
ncbi:MAG: ABC transporter ATP-binding protein [Flammeovirgaceae bacterium]|nr:ABC transporter ATP-binding protein [Flammeovirgaceae bacterium]MBE61593.1 ABC transporter ATP-binding protein [Flammeovirgaceae bacterium]MBR10225.1 ABC transporter ATP-binding protein [Rickettsiales bacterium]